MVGLKMKYRKELELSDRIHTTTFLFSPKILLQRPIFFNLFFLLKITKGGKTKRRNKPVTKFCKQKRQKEIIK